MTSLFSSFFHACRGIRIAVGAERNLRIQLTVAFIVFFASLWFGLSVYENIVLIFVTAAVLILEMLNTVLERFADAVHPRLHPIIKDIKDMMAGVVLVAVFAAVVVGSIVFYPYLRGLMYAILDPV